MHVQLFPTPQIGLPNHTSGQASVCLWPVSASLHLCVCVCVYPCLWLCLPYAASMFQAEYALGESSTSLSSFHLTDLTLHSIFSIWTCLRGNFTFSFSSFHFTSNSTQLTLTLVNVQYFPIWGWLSFKSLLFLKNNIPSPPWCLPFSYLSHFVSRSFSVPSWFPPYYLNLCNFLDFPWAFEIQGGLSSVKPEGTLQLKTYGVLICF